MQIWAEENPHVTREILFEYRFSVNGWARLINWGSLLRPQVFQRNSNR